MADILEPASQGNVTENGSQIINARGAAGGASFNTIYFFDNFGSGTVTLQVSPDSVEWFDLSTLTAKGFINFQARFEAIRFTLTGATSPDLNWKVV